MALRFFILSTVLVTSFSLNNAQLFADRRPFTGAEKREIITEANDLRSTLSSSDIECLRWSDQLEARAMDLAVQCQSNVDYLQFPQTDVQEMSCYFNGLVATVYTNVLEPYIRDFLFDWVLRGEMAYDYMANTCQPGNELSCQNYKRFVSSSASEIGCGRAYCSSIIGSATLGRPGFVVICALPARANLTGRPYKKESTECTMCQPNTGAISVNSHNIGIGLDNLLQQDQSICRQYQAGSLCCPINSHSNATVCRNRCLGKWHRLFSPNGGDHYYTTSDIQKSQAMKINYRYENFTGAILLPQGHESFSAADCVQACPEKVALHQLWSKSRRDHMYTIDGNTIVKMQKFMEGSYTVDAIAGYVVRQKGQCGASLAIHEYVSGGLLNSDHYYHTRHENIPGYKYNGIVFYIWDAL